jgi:two-component system response regulator CpxR
LVIDDDLELCELLAEYIEAEGFKVDSVQRGEHGIERGVSGEYALIILDVMLPGVNGFEVLRQLSTRSNSVPVLMLTARGQDVDRIVGLQLGADDYLAKPFNPRELVARIRTILRRTLPQRFVREQLSVGDIELDTGSRSVQRAGKPLELTAIEFSLLEILLRAAGHVVTREELAQVVLGRELTPFDRAIDVHVSKLRRKLGHRAGHAERIQSVRSVGYIYTQSSEVKEKGK